MLYINESAQATGKAVILDDMMLTTALPTTGGSKMLEGYLSLFDAQAVTDLAAAGYDIAGKANIGEFGFDLLGETSYFGPCTDCEGNLTTATAQLLESTDAVAAIGLDVNGTQRRSAALAGQVCVKPTYGAISRYGTIAIACSGEAVGVTAKTAAACQEMLDVLAGHDDKDGTSLPEERCQLITSAAPTSPLARVGIASGLVAASDEATQQRVAAAAKALKAWGIEVVEVDDAIIRLANKAWNVLMSAELCNNVSRFDGVKYGYRSAEDTTIGQLYTNSRTEAFGPLLKTAILFGSDVLSEENYDAMYDKGLRMRRVICEEFARIFTTCDALILPACSQTAYPLQAVQDNPYLVFDENEFTAPASITGLPAVVAGGIQIMGPAFSDTALLGLARRFEEAQ